MDGFVTALHTSIVSAIETVIAGLKGRITVLLVEQYLDFAIRLADSIVVLSRGAIVERSARGAISHADLTRHIAV